MIAVATTSRGLAGVSRCTMLPFTQRCCPQLTCRRSTSGGGHEPSELRRTGWSGVLPQLQRGCALAVIGHVDYVQEQIAPGPVGQVLLLHLQRSTPSRPRLREDRTAHVKRVAVQLGASIRNRHVGDPVRQCSSVRLLAPRLAPHWLWFLLTPSNTPDIKSWLPL